MSCALLLTNSGCWKTRCLLSLLVQCSLNVPAGIEGFAGVQGKALQSPVLAWRRAVTLPQLSNTHDLPQTVESDDANSRRGAHDCTVRLLRCYGEVWALLRCSAQCCQGHQGNACWRPDGLGPGGLSPLAQYRCRSFPCQSVGRRAGAGGVWDRDGEYTGGSGRHPAPAAPARV